MNESKNSGEVEEVIPALLAVLMGVLHFDLDMKDFSYSLSELTDSKFIIFLDTVICNTLVSEDVAFTSSSLKSPLLYFI